ncbi:DNA sulfur modification protein DndD [Vibrio hangzhouensis]|uniref:DNA sulfur modification protein DndD n=1 Tax=Vibrio hangzhouensis TaxID=462991 RepID=UPI001C949CD5|nr:DNA sulfur modification protein DndD [Vibrio hangzhouensis]MBY6197365.1 DNA sulfur modification protein DndD [Vibrio hangzhouensis]
MIIKSLVVNNFRVFRGVHEIDLAPRKQREYHEAPAPIVLFGGLNGAGKTSILTAVRVALYGRAAFGRGMSTTEYQEQLDALIHKGVGISEGKSSIELVFTHSQNGIESEYKITRGWSKGQKDRLLLEKDSEELSQMNYDQCQSFLNELIPSGIADLFFFDGEKIAELAEDESGEVLQTAVRRLLGIDVVERLRNDLAIYLKRNDAAAMPANIKTQIEKLESERIDAEYAAKALANEAALCKAKIDLIATNIDKAESELSSRGGAWARSREQEKAKQNELETERKELEKILRAEIEGNLPYSFAPTVLANLFTQLESEKSAKQAQNFNAELQSFMNELSQQLSFRLANAATALDTIQDCLNERSASQKESDILLDISDREFNQIYSQVNVQAPSSFSRFDAARQRLSIVAEEIPRLSENMARAPEQDQLESQLQAIKSLTKERTEAILEHKATTEDAKRKYREAIDLARKIQKLHDKHKVAHNAEASLANAQNAHIMLADFSEKLTQVRVKQLESEFINSYEKLARKEDLRLSARINTKSFDVELIDEKGHTISRKALSAGEKQIYAIAILEALGRTSGNQLPIIIDTPLGRLDSKHRDKLIQHYFPYASHQVIILSTDTEIDESYFNNTDFKFGISHAFEIQFDGTTKSSKLKEGYFWKQKAKAVVEVN